MKNHLTLKVLTILFVCLLSFLFLCSQEVGDWIELRATNPKGVPLHQRAESSMFGRALDGSIAQVIDTAEDGHWLKIRLQDGREGWIVEKYVGNVIDPQEEISEEVLDNENWLVWGSPDGCTQVVEGGGQLEEQSNEEIRVGTWNVRWFPEDTNVEWLACSIAWMNLDILAFQEFKYDNEAKNAINTLISKLNENTDGDWACDIQECYTSQRIGFLYNKDRLELSGQKDMWQFNARADANGSPCKGGLRPRRYCYVKSKQGGVDFHLVSVHLKSFTSSDAMAERDRAIDNIDQATPEMLQTDEDIIIVGDFNTMGRGSPESAMQEIEDIVSKACEENPGFIHLEIDPSCTEYYHGHGGWLDHVFVSEAMTEVTVRTANVYGYCEVKSCSDIDDTMPSAYFNLSDHCPVVFVIRDQDDDPNNN